MKKVKRASAKILSVLLAAVMFLSVVPMNSSAAEIIKKAAAADKLMKFATISDIHYYPAELTGNYCDAYMASLETSIAREPYESVGILNSALAALAEHAKTNGLEYVILPGDVSANSEYTAHVKLAEKLEQFEKDTGLKVLVINGNHDINKSSDAVTYENGYKENARAITPEEFKEVYKNLGYDLAYHTYTPKSGKGNMLSYSVCADGFRIIMIDASKYSPELTSDGTDEAETAGAFTPEGFQWVLDEVKDAKRCGETVLGVCHHNFVPHYLSEQSIIRGFVVDGWEELTDQLVDAGMHYSLTGHIHISDIASTVTDNGETLTEVCTDSLTAFPNYFREYEMTNEASGRETLNVDSFDVDCVLPVTVNGYTYSQPFRTESLGRTFFDDSGLYGLAERLIGGYLKQFSGEFEENGVLETLKGMGLDLEAMLQNLIGGGLVIGGKEIFTSKNLLSFIEDLLAQIQQAYLANPEATTEYIMNSLNKLLSVQVSELPCTRFYDSYGIGSKTEPGTFEDLLECAIMYMYDGTLLMEDDPFMTDVIYQLENGDTIFELFDALLDIVANDLLQEKILNDIELRPGALFYKGGFGYNIGRAFDIALKVVFLGNTSLLNISNTILGLANKLQLVEFDSLWGIVEHYMDEYLTDTQLEGIGQTLADILRGFAQDPSYNEDYSTTAVYDGKVEVEATRENYRLPTNAAVTFGADQGSRNISWYTKPSVQGTDIEIIEDTKNPVFTGKNSVPFYVTVNRSTQKTTRSYPGVDLGVIGIMNYEFPMNRHVVNVSGLQPGKTYLYKIGDASRGWWSETGSFEVADGGDETTFVHICDPQSQSAQQYKTFSNVIAKAYEMYDSDFIISTGDCVDHGDNFKQWRWFLDGASETLLNTVLMSASGNHEDKGEYAIVTNFTFSDIPEQDAKTGVYYSFDYNNVHVAVLNTNDLDKDESLSDAQVDWLIEDMESSDADWKMVAFHKAMYSNGSHYDDKDVCAIRDELSVLMPQLGIDVVFQGHDHVYLRTDAMIDNEVESVTTSAAAFEGREYTVKENPVGTVYAISGCAGVKAYKQKDASLTDKYFPRAEAICDVEYSVFSGVKIVGDTLYFDAYEVNPETSEAKRIDSFAIRKDLSVKKGTGVEEKLDIVAVFTQIIELAVPVLKWFVEQITSFLSSKVF